MRTVDDMVRQEVICCLSHLVSTLAGNGSDGWREYSALNELCDQAQELTFPIDDFEEAAIQSNWSGPHRDEFGTTFFRCDSDGATWACADWCELCEAHDIAPYQREVFDHWAVSEWFAEQLERAGEKVDRDFANLCVWARCTTGQSIAQDEIVQQIHAKAAARIAEALT